MPKMQPSTQVTYDIWYQYPGQDWEKLEENIETLDDAQEMLAEYWLVYADVRGAKLQLKPNTIIDKAKQQVRDFFNVDI